MRLDHALFGEYLVFTPKLEGPGQLQPRHALGFGVLCFVPIKQSLIRSFPIYPFCRFAPAIDTCYIVGFSLAISNVQMNSCNDRQPCMLHFREHDQTVRHRG